METVNVRFDAQVRGDNRIAGKLSIPVKKHRRRGQRQGRRGQDTVT
ncbi:MAG: hypothetical protein R2838_11855 [Caldilineaceae bacterium]